jgi:hypothetical protein
MNNIDSNSIESARRRDLSKIINRYRESFPSEVKEIKFIKTNGTIIIDFFDENLKSMADKMASKIVIGEKSLFYVVSEDFKKILSKSNYAIENKEYTFRPFLKKESREYLDLDVISGMIRKENEPITSIAYRVNIDQGILYALSNKWIRNYTTHTIIKLCLYFKKPIYMFLQGKLKKWYLEILTDELVNKKLITKEKKAKIIQFYCPPQP